MNHGITRRIRICSYRVAKSGSHVQGRMPDQPVRDHHSTFGRLLAAFDISGGKRTVLMEKAAELAEVLFTAFGNPKRMSTSHFTWSA